MSIYVGTGRINYPAMRGPCPYGYHVGTHTEWSAINLAGINLGAWSGNNGIGLMTYLKLPMAGLRSNSNGAVLYQGADGYYTCCDVNSSNAPYQFFFYNTHIAVTTGAKKGGQSIRPIKDVPVIPTSSWTTLYDGSSVASGAGIFYRIGSNDNYGEISISADGKTWYTIMDRNLGATTVYNYGDTFSASNCGCFFQRGNNYPFPGSGSVSTSTTAIDASAYGPGNWYYDSTWRYPSGSDRSSVTNNNLRGGVVGAVKADVKDVCVGAGVDDRTYLQGPCPDGFHVPYPQDRIGVYNAGITLGAWTSGSGGSTNFMTKLHIPKAGCLWENTGNYTSGYGYYWSSFASVSGGTRLYASFLQVSDLSFPGGVTNRCQSIRAFKDVPVVPDSTWTTIQSGTGGAGIYRNKGLGLISISSNGTKRYTMQDKNLGAKIVWNNGDATNADNCGGFFQRGNNYMFPFSGASTKSGNKVDASGYGPGNYYNNSTFITASGWDSYQNNNLRGGWNIYKNDQGALVNKPPLKGNVKQVYVGTTPARPTYNPGIYWNKAKGLISMSKDGKNWITIADKNMGARVVYNYGDTLSQDNCGYYYQWGNNYGFAFTGTVSNTTTRVNASTYGPTNPYYGSTFVKYSGDWSSSQNDNLWGNTTNTLVARQGPCPADFHVATYTERNSLRNTRIALGQNGQDGANFGKLLKLPFTGYRSTQGIAYNGSAGRYWTSSTSSTDANRIHFASSNMIFDGIEARAMGNAIRPFKNEPVVPDNSRAILYQPS